MNEYRFSAEVARQTRTATVTDFSALGERRYGTIRVQADWTPLASGDDIVRIDVTVIGDLAPRDVPSYVELFFHDAFLLFNIAIPGSFGGVITVTGGEFRVNDLSFDAAPFACGASSISLADVVAWHRGETNQIASTPMQTVFFHLLHIGRESHDAWMLRVRLSDCLKALGIDESIAEVRLTHPMHDETLDAGIDDGAMDIIDGAMVRVLTAIQDAARAT